MPLSVNGKMTENGSEGSVVENGNDGSVAESGDDGGGVLEANATAGGRCVHYVHCASGVTLVDDRPPFEDAGAESLIEVS